MQPSENASASSADEPEESLPEYVVVTDLLDLHGAPIDIIPQMIVDFIDHAVELGLTTVQIIHGKGKSRLKYLTHQQLKAHAAVAEFYDAPPDQGGWGRTVVRLKSDRNRNADL
ncbi:MAG: Smr/MutS family protein [candidate division KSB1 bacterium]|nr:Smr/MutS family protein [candidate division KSB1 bacterium]